MSNGIRYIQFADPEVERICIANFSTDGIGVTYDDAAAVTSLSRKFRANVDIISFEELRYFTSLATFGEDFFGCTSLGRIVIPEGTETIGAYCMYNTALTELVIPSTITYLGAQCIGSSPLVQIVALPTVPPEVQLGNLGQINSLQRIYVPYSADHSVLSAYKSAAGWSTHESKILELNPMERYRVTN